MPRDCKRIEVKGTLPHSIVEVEHSEERLIILVAVNEVSARRIVVQFEASRPQSQRLLTRHARRQAAASAARIALPLARRASTAAAASSLAREEGGAGSR